MHDKQHKSTEKFREICEMKHRIFDYINGQIADGLENDPQKVIVLGQYIDMIKDLAETEKACHEACYYESVVEAMDEAKEMGDYGMNDRMGYPRGRNAMGQFTSRGRSGYDGDWRMSDRDMRPDDEDYDDRYGRPFNQFRKARRHYTRTHSEEDKEKMKVHANEHMTETMATMREIYDSADPDMKKRMKADLTKLANELTV